MQNNPFESPQQQSQLAKDSPKKRSALATVFKVGLVIAAVLLLIALFLPATRRVREPARRAGCINNLRQVGLAILNYESATGALPPAYTIDENGNRLHSWRTLILPYMEEQALYESIDLAKPWDDPVNKRARETAVYPYLCPSATHDEWLTTYLAVVGPKRGFSGPTGRPDLEKFDWAKQISIVEVPSDDAIHWMSPHDTDVEILSRLHEDSNMNHSGTMVTVFFDNHTETVWLGELDEFLARITNAEKE